MNDAVSSDAGARDRLVRELDRTFFVEAAAGTGKTTALVTRIVALVADGQLEMEGLAAITFTEAAAGELRDRVRRGLECAARDQALSEEMRARCAKGAAEVDLATIQTIHAFAATLLRTFPIEAGLPPSFAIWDEIQSEIAFDEQFRRWLYDDATVGEDSARREAVRRVLLLGMSVDQIRDLARDLQQQADLLSSETRWPAPSPPDAVELAHDAGARLLALAPLVACARNGPADRLAREIEKVQFAAQRMAQAEDEVEALAALQGLPKSRTNVGRKTDWDPAPGIPDPVSHVRDTLREVWHEVDVALRAHRTAALAALLEHLRDFTLWTAEERRRQGAASFHDLLTWARNLLRDRPEVRVRARRRFTRIFVDEFQDTDPLQAEIVWYLAADPAAPDDGDWRDLRLSPGKLFVVGDPKQSIYRFRRADIATYDALADRMVGGERVALTCNFRSVSEIIWWVNEHFVHDIVPMPSVQPPYLPLEPGERVRKLADWPRGVFTFGEKLDGRMDEVWQREAIALAALAKRIVQEGWLVREPDDTVRPARLADIAVLMPTRTNARRIERVFERYDVPYRVESGSLVLATQEVRDLIAALRAIDDPSDQVALVAALRSPIYGCSDVDLLAWVEAGHPLNYEQAPDDASGPVAEAFASLRRLHVARVDRSAAATVEALIRERMLAIQAFGQPRPREAWRRLRYVVAQARALGSAGRSTLRGLVDWLEGLQRAEVRDHESPRPEPDEDAVRLLTVHAAKGLEFPITVVSGLGLRSRGRKPLLIPNRQTGQIAVRCGDFETVDYEEAYEREKQMEEAEQRRLLYVATTRARDHLVLSLFHNDDDSHAGRIARHLEVCAAPLHRPLENLVPREPEPGRSGAWWLPPSDGASSGATGAAGHDVRSDPHRTADTSAPVTSPAEHAAAEARWLDERSARVATRAREIVRRASELSALDGVAGISEDEEHRADDEPVGDTLLREIWRGRGTTPLGRAVQAALRAVDLRQPNGLPRIGAACARQHGLDDSVDAVVRLVRSVVENPFVRRGVTEGRFWRGVPVGVATDDVVVEDEVDLLCESADGSLTAFLFVADPVDRAAIDAPDSPWRARAAVSAFTLARTLGRRVRSLLYVFATLDGLTVAYHDLDVLAREGERIVTTPSGSGVDSG